MRDGRLQLGLIVPPPKASALHDLRYEELFRVRVVVAPQHPFARHRAIPIAEVAAALLIGLLLNALQRRPEREVPLCDVVFDYPRDHDCFLSKVPSPLLTRMVIFP